MRPTSPPDSHGSAASDVEVLCRSLHLIPAVLFVSLSSSTASTATIAATRLITTGLVALTMCCLRVISTSSAYSSLSPRLRFTAAHTLAVLAASHFTLTVTVLNTLLLCVISADTISDGDRVAVLAAVCRILLFIPSAYFGYIRWGQACKVAVSSRLLFGVRSECYLVSDPCLPEDVSKLVDLTLGHRKPVKQERRGR